jgi:hypothetical protein
LAFGVMLVFGCSSEETSSGSGGGCGGGASAARCEINADASVCGEHITLECFDGGSPDGSLQCAKAFEHEEEAIYCCPNAALGAEPEAESDGSGGSGGAGT